MDMSHISLAPGFSRVVWRMMMGSAAASAAVRCASRRTRARAGTPSGGIISRATVSREARLTAPEAGALPESSCVGSASAVCGSRKPLKRFKFELPFNTQLKLGVNEMF